MYKIKHFYIHYYKYIYVKGFIDLYWGYQCNYERVRRYLKRVVIAGFRELLRFSCKLFKKLYNTNPFNRKKTSCKNYIEILVKKYILKIGL